MKFSSILFFSFVLAIVASAVDPNPNVVITVPKAVITPAVIDEDSEQYDFGSVPVAILENLTALTENVAKVFNGTDSNLAADIDKLSRRSVNLKVQLASAESQCAQKTELDAIIDVVAEMTQQLQSSNPGTIGDADVNAATDIVEFNNSLANLKNQLQSANSQCEEQTEVGAVIDGVEAIIQRLKSARDLNAAVDVADLSDRFINLFNQLAFVDAQCKEPTTLGSVQEDVLDMIEQLKNSNPGSLLELKVLWTKIEKGISDFQIQLALARSNKEQEV